MTIKTGYIYLDDKQVTTLLQVLSLTSVDNEIVRELIQLFQGAPVLEIVEATDSAGEECWALKCPHCGALSFTGDDPDYNKGVRVVDIDVRTSDFAYDHEAETIHGYYNDDSSGHETWAYECGACGKDVSLPPGVTEEGEYG